MKNHERPQKKSNQFNQTEKDITEVTMTEKIFSEPEETFRIIFENAFDGILLAHINDKKFHISNKTACNMLGYGPEEINNLEVKDIHPEESLPYVLKQFEMQKNGIISIAKDIPVKRKDRSVFYADINSSVVRIKEKEYLMGIFRDITERKNMEDLLKKTLNLKEKFLDTMTHELLTPINVILGMSEALLEEIFGPVNKKQMAYLEIIESNGKHLLSLINDILTISNLEAGMLEIERDKLPVSSLCMDIMKFITELANKKGIKSYLTIDSDVDKIETDKCMLKKILEHLLLNAVKFTPPGGEVYLKVIGDLKNNLVNFTVCDSGIGISEENLKYLFQPFVQLDNRLCRHYQGTGIGLTVAKGLSELLGGKISVESQEGKGTCFTLSLPWLWKSVIDNESNLDS